MKISLEPDQSTELSVLRVDPASEAAKYFNGKAVMVCALEAKRGKILWVRSEAVQPEPVPPEPKRMNGLVAASTYSELQNQENGGTKTDQFELRKLTYVQRLARYGRLDIILALIAVLVAAAAAAATLKLFHNPAATDTVAIVGPLLTAVLGVVSASRQVGSPPW